MRVTIELQSNQRRFIAEAPGIEVGAAGDDLRYWRSKEAVRQAEARLTAQNAVRAALEARATAVTGWAAVALTGAVGAFFSSSGGPAKIGIAVASTLLFIVAYAGIRAARPGDWTMAGYDPVVLLESPLETELEEMESIAKGYSPGIQSNNNRLNSMGKAIRLAGLLLVLAPVAGGLAYLVAPRLISAWEDGLQRFRLERASPAAAGVRDALPYGSHTTPAR